MTAMMNHRIMSSSAGFASMDPQLRKSNVSEEIEKYKQMKAQGLLNTVQSEKTSKNTSYLAHSNSLEQFLHTSPEELRSSYSSVSSLHQAPSTSKSSKGYQPSQLLQRALTTSSPIGFSTTPLLRGALHHYLNKNGTSPRSPLSLNSSFLRDKARSPVNSAKKSFPLDIDDTKSSPTKTPNTPEIPSQSILRNSENGQRLPGSPHRVYSSANLQKFNSFPAKRKPAPTTVTFDLGQQQNQGKQGGLFRSQIVKTEKEAKSHEVYQEVVQWRSFGQQMAASYKELNEKFKSFIQVKEQTQTEIEMLTQEAEDLETQVQKAKEDSPKSDQQQQQQQQNSLNISALRESVEQARREREQIKEALEILKNENAGLKKAVDDLKKYDNEVEYYQTLAESRLKERSTLTEEIIKLRTNLDRSHSNYLKVQRSRTMAVESEDAPQEPKSRGSSLKKSKSKGDNSAKKEVKWKDELEEDSSILSSPSRRV